MTVNHLASNYKTLIAIPFIIILFGIGMGLLPLAEGMNPIDAMAMLLVPILALIASDHMDTYQLFKSGVYKLAAIDFADDRIDKALDAGVKGIEIFEGLTNTGNETLSNAQKHAPEMLSLSLATRFIEPYNPNVLDPNKKLSPDG